MLNGATNLTYCSSAARKMVKISGILLSLLSALCLLATHAEDEARCCLCNRCESPAYAKLDMILLGPGHEQQTTCISLAADLEITQRQSSKQCQDARTHYSEACCAEDFDDTPAMEVTTPDAPQIGRAARILSFFGSSSDSCANNRFASNDVEFDTPGGACSCPVCKSGADPDAWLGATVYVPGRGTYKGSCAYLDIIGKFVHNVAVIKQTREILT